MDDHNLGRRRARWTTRALVAASLAAAAGLTGVAVAEQHTAATTTAGNAGTTSSTPAAAPTVTAGTGSSHANTAGS